MSILELKFCLLKLGTSGDSGTSFDVVIGRACWKMLSEEYPFLSTMNVEHQNAALASLGLGLD
jgi:hypothetical protein